LSWRSRTRRTGRARRIRERATTWRSRQRRSKKEQAVSENSERQCLGRPDPVEVEQPAKVVSHQVLGDRPHRPSGPSFEKCALPRENRCERTELSGPPKDDHGKHRGRMLTEKSPIEARTMCCHESCLFSGGASAPPSLRYAKACYPSAWLANDEIPLALQRQLDFGGCVRSLAGMQSIIRALSATKHRRQRLAYCPGDDVGFRDTFPTWSADECGLRPAS